MPLARSLSMVPTMPRSRSASMSSLAQVDLSTLDADVVLDYARKVILLQPQPATSAGKLQMLFALSQKLLKWLIEDREAQIMPQHPNPQLPPGRFEVPVSPLSALKPKAASVYTQHPKQSSKPGVASRIWASAATPVEVSNVALTFTTDVSVATKGSPKTSPARPAEKYPPKKTPAQQNQKPESNNLQPIPEKIKPPVGLSPKPELDDGQCVQAPEKSIQHRPPRRDSLQVYLEVQRSVLCIQKNARGFMARRKFFRALEDLLQGRA